MRRESHIAAMLVAGSLFLSGCATWLVEMTPFKRTLDEEIRIVPVGSGAELRLPGHPPSYQHALGIGIAAFFVWGFGTVLYGALGASALNQVSGAVGGTLMALVMFGDAAIAVVRTRWHHPDYPERLALRLTGTPLVAWQRDLVPYPAVAATPAPGEKVPLEFRPVRPAASLPSTESFPIAPWMFDLPWQLEYYRSTGQMIKSLPLEFRSSDWGPRLYRDEAALAAARDFPGLSLSKASARSEMRSDTQGSTRIRLTVGIQNRGADGARDVRATLLSGDPRVAVSQEGAARLGTLAPGKSADFRSDLLVPWDYDGPPKLPIWVVCEEARPDAMRIRSVPVFLDGGAERTPPL